MDSTIVMNRYFHRNSDAGGLRAALLALSLCTVALNGCYHPAEGFGKERDLTDDLHHRLQSGLFRPASDPTILQLYKDNSDKRAPHQIVRLSWEKGSLLIRADDHALIVFYMDQEATLSHAKVSSAKDIGLALQFRADYQHPIR